MRKVRDFYFQKAKQDRYPARSVYKLEEAQKKYQLLRPGNRVLDLGCQPGSWSMYAARIVGKNGLVVGLDLKEGEKNTRAGAADILWLRMDVFGPDVAAALRKISPVYQVVLSDMAPRTTGNKWVDQQQSLRLAIRSLEISGEVLARDGNFYCKVFEGEDFRDFVAGVRVQFRTVKIVKPKSSRTESREVFVLGLGYMGKMQAEDC